MRRFTITLAAAFAIVACGDTAQDTAEQADTTAMDTMAAAPPTADASAAMLNPNDATAEQLATVPNIDAALADALAAGRPYADMRAVDAVLAGSLSEEQRDSVYTRLWIPIDLNSASDEEILLIPGIGDRMLHEFKEYRPYTNIEQFRREIGKYVDDEEVARLEQYVTIR